MMTAAPNTSAPRTVPLRRIMDCLQESSRKGTMAAMTVKSRTWAFSQAQYSQAKATSANTSPMRTAKVNLAESRLASWPTTFSRVPMSKDLQFP